MSSETHPGSGASGEITLLLRRLRDGDREVQSRLFDLVYLELHSIAKRQAANERPDHTLAPTAIVHEAYLRLFGGTPPSWNDRAHFYLTATRVMRNLLVDYARRRSAQKKAGIHEPFHDGHVGSDGRDLDETLLVDQALTLLSGRDERQAQIYELRYLAGLTTDEIAEALGIGKRTVFRELRSATAWLNAEVARNRGRAAAPPDLE